MKSMRQWRFTLVCLSGLLGASLSPSSALGQGDLPPNPYGSPLVNWAEIEAALAPLEQIQLAPPSVLGNRSGELQRYLARGEVAPWGGLLLNPPAAAFVLSEYQAVQSRASLALQRQRDSDWNRLIHELVTVRISMEAMESAHGVERDGSQEEIARLQRINRDLSETINKPRFFQNFLRIALSFLAGAGVGALVGIVLAP
jgi:hypothetical protein